MEKLPEWLTFSQASDLKNISRQTLYQWKNQKKIIIKEGENGVLLIRNNKKFQNLKPESNRKRRDLLMERLESIEGEVKRLKKKIKKLEGMK